MHDWPANPFALIAAASAAASRSASAQTISGVELPSSSETCFFRARPASSQPTSAEPVKVIILTRSSSTKTLPISAAGPVTIDSSSRGSPASWRIATSSIAASGATDAGFSTAPQPAATAGPTLCAARLSGKLNGVIAATTPIGTRMV
jgi:hypothetical protein